MTPRNPSAASDDTPLAALLQEAARRGADLIDELVPRTREALLRQIEATRDLAERDAIARAIGALLQTAPQLRGDYAAALREAFEREVRGDPPTTTPDAGPTSLRFDELELMDEQQVQARIAAARGLQQALLAAEIELADLNALVCALLGLREVQSERNPLRPQVYLDTLQEVIGRAGGDAASRQRWAQAMVPQLGAQLRPLYRQLLALLQQQRVQPARYAIRTAPVAGPALAAAPGSARGSQLTVQQLRGLMNGSAQDIEALAQEVVNLVITHIAGDPRVLPAVWQLVYELEPALLALARADLNFFHDRHHPARVLLEEVIRHGFAYPSEEAPGFIDFVAQVRPVLHDIDPAQAASPAPFARALEQLRQLWAQAERAQQQRREAAIRALQQAEQRNRLAQQIAEHIRAQPETVLVPDVVVEFACGPWAQVMAQAQVSGRAGQPGVPDYLALLEDLFWSVRPDLTRKQPGQLARVVPALLQGLREGLQTIAYPSEQAQAFFDQLFELHQGRRAQPVAAPARPVPGQPWLAPQEARESGFIDDLGSPPAAADAGFAATEPAALEPDFPATEPMGLPPLAAAVAAAQSAAPATPLALEQLQPGQWVEIQAGGHWLRLQLAWRSDNATLCLFTSAQGANHSMTRRMFDRLVAQGQLRALAADAVVDRAFDAVAALALRNSAAQDGADRPPA
ncbi:MAG: DUF1631 family protein [Hylemonella sp.]